MDFATLIIKWYRKNKRDLPWRETTNPYKIWLSEIILQQTRVDQGLSYYKSFTETFPTIQLLAKAPEIKILKLWQGLGYYSRARNLHHTAKQIVKENEGKFPSEYNDLLKLKGIGKYTAAAIASFSFNQPYAVIDGNVTRVISRFCGITKAVDESSTIKKIDNIANELLDKKRPGIYNQSIMELGAIVCKPQNPLCDICVLKNGCVAFEKKLTGKIPLKSKKIVVRKRYLNYFFINTIRSRKAYTYLRKRSSMDIWKNLYDFPGIETQSIVLPEELFLTNEWKSIFGKSKVVILHTSQIIKHQLSHQELHAIFYDVSVKPPLFKLAKDIIEIPLEKLSDFPFPRLIDRYLSR